MSGARAWLPPGANCPALEEVISAAVDHWSRSWFGDGDVAVAPALPVDRVRPQAGQRRECGSHGWLTFPDDTLIALGAASLHLADGRTDHQNDRQLLLSVGEECATALCEQLRAALGFAGKGGYGQGVGIQVAALSWTITRRESLLRLTFLMSEEGRVSAIRHTLPPPVVPRTLDSATAALAPLSADLSASLGRCKLSVSELTSLSPGDVLLFEGAVDTTLPLAINDSLLAQGACTVSREDDLLVLEITQPLVGY